MPLPFRDRHDAGRQLADRLTARADSTTVVLGLPRGGVPVAYEIAHALHATLNIFMLRHLVADGEPSMTLGVLGTGGVCALNHELIAAAGVARDDLEELTKRERISLIARERTFTGRAMDLELTGRTVILVDDGSSSEQYLREAVSVLRHHDPRRIIVAVPILAAPVAHSLGRLADAVVHIVAPTGCAAPERWHREFQPISHTEVRALLALSLAEAQSRELATAAGS
jgi:putative phosphoribosyl transferase